MSETVGTSAADQTGATESTRQSMGLGGEAVGETIGVFDAKTHLSRLLEEVQRGKTFTITRRGRPVAVLAPPSVLTRRVHPMQLPRYDPERIKYAWEQWVRYRDTRGLRATTAEIRESIGEGRREP